MRRPLNADAQVMRNDDIWLGVFIGLLVGWVAAFAIVAITLYLRHNSTGYDCAPGHYVVQQGTPYEVTTCRKELQP